MDDDGQGVVLGEGRYLVDGRETCFWCPGAIRDGPMLAAGARSTGPRIVSTMRNWNTICRLSALL